MRTRYSDDHKLDEKAWYARHLIFNVLDVDAATLLHMLYSFILVSYAVNVFLQNRTPDSGAAFFGMVAEPAV